MRVLCTGDIHIGRCSAGVPSNYRCSAADSWLRIVDLAVERRVNAVVLAGDVVDERAALFEAFGALGKGVAALHAAGIRVIAIAGNHDWHALPDIARKLEGLDLLGVDGQWDCATVEGFREPDLTVVGWSFPRRACAAPPLAARPRPAGGGYVLGLVHGTLDGGTGDPYAPVAANDLAGAAGVTAWVVGHTHRPCQLMSGGAPIVGVGSPQALDFGEQGVRGPWLLNLAPGRDPDVEHLCFSTASYVEVRVDVTGLDPGADLAEAVQNTVRDQVCRLPDVADASNRYCQVRLTLTGTTESLATLCAAADRLKDAETLFEPHTKLDAVTVDALPAHDLEQLAAEKHAAGRLARLLLELDGSADPGEVTANLIVDAERARSEQWRKYPDAGDAPSEDVRAVLRREAARLLDAALAAQAKAGKGN